MKKFAILIVSVLFVAGLIFGQAKQPAVQNTIQEITALENAWNGAWQKYDVSWFERNLADTYHGTDEDGVVTDKAAVISNTKNKVSKIDSISFENFKVQVYGDTAVATAVSVIKGTYKGKDITGKYPWTDTWVKLGGRWQCVAGHSSRLAYKK
jgi:ketosteroid isomerase-like protein